MVLDLEYGKIWSGNSVASLKASQIEQDAKAVIIVAMFTDLSNFFGENSVITDRNYNQNYKNKIL